mgnify:FL=1
MQKSNFKEIKTFDVNPFPVEGIVKRQYIPKTEERMVTDTTTGQLFIQKEIPITKEVFHDNMSFTKVFKTNLTGNLKNLTIPASNMLLLIIERLEINHQKICLTEDDYLSHFNYAKGSKRLYYQSVTELIDSRIIAKVNGATRCYWINVNILFNGDRTKL